VSFHLSLVLSLWRNSQFSTFSCPYPRPSRSPQNNTIRSHQLPAELKHSFISHFIRQEELPSEVLSHCTLDVIHRVGRNHPLSTGLLRYLQSLFNARPATSDNSCRKRRVIRGRLIIISGHLKRGSFPQTGYRFTSTTNTLNIAGFLAQ